MNKSPLHNYINDMRTIREQGGTYSDIADALAQEAALFYTESALRSFWMRHIKPELNLQDVI